MADKQRPEPSTMFLSIDRPCEEKLERLAAAYNELADRWQEKNERADHLEQRVRELEEALRGIMDLDWKDGVFYERAAAALAPNTSGEDHE